jgi:hypothetical protein
LMVVKSNLNHELLAKQTVYEIICKIQDRKMKI